MSSPLDSQSPAERLYFDFAAKRERGEASDADFEQLCMAHPELAHELRQLARREQGFRSLFAAGEAAQNADSVSAAPLPRVFTAGEVIGDFRLERSLGAGGMGQVWEATQLSLQRRVALKFVRSDRISEQYLARFEVEARAGGRADHPNLVRTLGRGQAEGVNWIAQELVVGAKSLQAKLDEFRREPIRQTDFYEQAAQTIRDAALGMQAAHDAGVIHRDLKPANILLDRTGKPRIVDFGLARMVDEPGQTATGHIAGTLNYMSPEQTEGRSAALDHRTDIFSLGVVLYELLTLQRPFDGESSQEILEKVRTLDPIDPRQLRANCPKDLSTICLKALEKRPGARYATMQALAEDLNRFLKHEPILARPSTRLELARKWVRRNPGPSVGIGVGAAALVVISGVAIYALGQKAVAERNANEAKANMELAERNAETAQRNANDATQKANDVLSLSAQKDYEDLVAAAEKLWPADSAMVPRYEEWLAKARELVGGRPADEAKGQKKRPSLAEHKAKLAELRREALPLSEEQVRVDRETHSQFAEWQAKSADLLWRSRMLAIEAWPDRAAVEAELAAEVAAKQLPSDPDGLNALAWKLVNPKQPVFGQEVRALLMAKRALAAAEPSAGANGTANGTDGNSGQAASGEGSGSASATGSSLAGIRKTYAWALYRTGKLDEALGEMKTALTEPGGDELKQSGKDLEKAVRQWQGDEVAKRRERRETLSKDVDALAAAVNERGTFEYTDAEKTWWDRQLRVLVANLENFQNPDSGLMGSGVNPDFGWGVQKRYDFAKSVRERTITSAEAKRRWDEAILAIAKSEKYRDTVFPGGALLTPQEGLLPLGTDPQSGLWEFWHVQSGDEPERDKDGNFVRQKSGAHKLVENSGAAANAAASRAGGETSMLGAAGANGARGTGIVLVLIPGGTFWMGAQKTDTSGQNYDGEARSNESVHRVTLSPYFLSKYELTQGQWSRFTGLNPSNYKSGFNGTVGITNPVEQVDWLTCERVTRGLGLELPSEAQWECGARGGTSSAWWTGSAKESLADKVNLADQSYVAAGGQASVAAWWPEFKDGFEVHAPVGRLAANGFGLHEVCGNVWEWCFDADGDYPEAGDASSATRDPRVDGDGLATRVYRGGSFNVAAPNARSAFRSASTPTNQSRNLGVRPSRALRLSTSPPHPLK